MRSTLSHCSSSISIHRPIHQMHVNHFSMQYSLHVHCCYNKAIMIATESVCFQAGLRAVLNVSTHSQSAIPTQQLTSAPLTKCSLTLQVDFRDHLCSLSKYRVDETRRHHYTDGRAASACRRDSPLPPKYSRDLRQNKVK